MSKMPQAQLVLEERVEVHPEVHPAMAAIIVAPTFIVTQWLVERVVFHSPVAAATAWLAVDPARLLLTSPALVASLADLPTLKKWRISFDDRVVVGAKR